MAGSIIETPDSVMLVTSPTPRSKTTATKLGVFFPDWSISNEPKSFRLAKQLWPIFCKPIFYFHNVRFWFSLQTSPSLLYRWSKSTRLISVSVPLHFPMMIRPCLNYQLPFFISPKRITTGGQTKLLKNMINIIFIKSKERLISFCSWISSKRKFRFSKIQICEMLF